MRRLVRSLDSALITVECWMCRDKIQVLRKDLLPESLVFCSANCRRVFCGIRTSIGSKKRRNYRFYKSIEWRMLRKLVINKYGRSCMKCKILCRGRKLHVDHIKPKSVFPELALTFDNLQILCEACNSIKGKSIVDYRPIPKDLDSKELNIGNN